MSIYSGISEYQCCFSNNLHLTRKAIRLACGHYICKTCCPLSYETINHTIQCNICSKLNIDLILANIKPVEIGKMLDLNTIEKFNKIYNNDFNNTIHQLKGYTKYFSSQAS